MGRTQLQGWPRARTEMEYLRHSCPKDRSVDMDFVRLFDLSPLRAELRRLHEGQHLVDWPGLLTTLQKESDEEEYPQHPFDPSQSLQGGRPYDPKAKRAFKLARRAAGAVDLDDGSDFLAKASRLALQYGLDCEKKASSDRPACT